MKRYGIVIVCIGLILIGGLAPSGARDRGVIQVSAAWAQEDWRKEFDDVCSKTQDAMVFSADELRDLVGRCDRLKPRIEKLDESQRKVYLKRLQMCRDLYLFVLESRK